ncbi:MAG: hypothetical protein ACWGMZ_02385 [Thermoguttaceae bacterium]
MIRALVLKELREVFGFAAAAFVAYMAMVLNQMGYDFLPFFSSPGDGMIPFCPMDGYIIWFAFISIVFAIALGLWQTVVESGRGTWPFLLHRPMARMELIGLKMAVGAATYLGVSALATLIYACWAALPGTHASPFFWWMTKMVWLMWIIILPCYFGAFLTGIRPARWIGTRLLPLAGTGFLAVLFGILSSDRKLSLFGVLGVIIECVLLVGVILHVARTRDFG